MNKKTKQRLADLQGVLLKLLETSEDKEETAFLYDFLEKINKKIGE